VYGLNVKTLLNCFISGLNPEIRKEMVIHHQRIGRACLLEAKHKDTKLKPSLHPNPTNPIPTSQTIPTTPIPSSLPIKRVNQAHIN